MDYLWSDTHFGHENIIKYSERPFKDAKEMDDCLIKNHNEIVGPDDTVYHLGDFALCEDWRKREIVASLNGYKILILGNHDFWPKSLYKGLTPEDKIELAKVLYLDLGFDEVYGECEIIYKGWYLTHMPQTKKAKYLCGHVHCQWEVQDLRPHGALNLNVGVDVNNFKPVTLEELTKGVL